MMAHEPTWGPGSDQYVRQPGGSSSRGRTIDGPSAAEQRRFTGITWDRTAIDVEIIGGTGDIERARHRFRERTPTMIWDAARLEGNTFTLPEVRTLLDGVTVEGKLIEEQQQVLALNVGFNDLDLLVGDGTFTVSKAVSDKIHREVAKYEAIEAGHFRGEGSANGGGSVRLSHGGTTEGRAHGEAGALLIEAFQDLADYLDGVADHRLRALIYVASAVRHQFYFDGNKRTAKLMGSGLLMAHGYDAISIPYTRLHEQNLALDDLFSTDDATAFMRLLAESAH